MGSLYLQAQERLKAWPCLAQGVFSDGSCCFQHSVSRRGHGHHSQEGCVSPQQCPSGLQPGFLQAVGSELSWPYCAPPSSKSEGPPGLTPGNSLGG